MSDTVSDTPIHTPLSKEAFYAIDIREVRPQHHAQFNFPMPDAFDRMERAHQHKLSVSQEFRRNRGR